MDTPMRFVILSPPRTKKTSNQIVKAKGRRLIIPSKAHQVWFRAALPQARLAMAGRPPIDRPVNVAAVFYRDAERGDAVGYYQALADLLERAGIVTDDKLIVSWDNSRLMKDAANPRIEVEIKSLDNG